LNPYDNYPEYVPTSNAVPICFIGLANNKGMKSIKILKTDMNQTTKKELRNTFVAGEHGDIVREKYHHIGSLNTQ
jgi:hypothetical protein